MPTVSSTVTPEFFARCVRTARSELGLTAAEFDYQLITGQPTRPGPRDEDALDAQQAILDCAFRFTYAALPVVGPTVEEFDALMDEHIKPVLRAVQPMIEEMRAAAAAKKYVGWASGSKIRYA